MRSIKSLLALPFAQRVSSKVRKWAKKPIETQEKVFRNLISSGTKTAFGQDHDFISINSYQDFKKRVPIRDYEALKPYVDRVVSGELCVMGRETYILRKDFRNYFGSKYIPIQRQVCQLILSF